jgi:uncharacterized protein YoxC
MSNLKKRNWAVLAAIMALAALIFTITIVKITEGVEKRLEQSQKP